VATLVEPRDPGGILQHAAAVLGLGVDEFRDLPLPHQRRGMRPGGRVGEQHLHVARAHVLAVELVGAARVAGDPADDVDVIGVVEPGGRERWALSIWTWTSAKFRAGRVAAPAKITSSIPSPRMAVGRFSPITQRSASSRFDLPQPFGPTTPVRPSAITRSVGSTNDLNPFSRSLLNRTCLPRIFRFRSRQCPKRGGGESICTLNAYCSMARIIPNISLRILHMGGRTEQFYAHFSAYLRRTVH
jgi:hypothetical protein